MVSRDAGDGMMERRFAVCNDIVDEALRNLAPLLFSVLPSLPEKQPGLHVQRHEIERR